jgi:hypothetical protein
MLEKMKSQNKKFVIEPKEDEDEEEPIEED